MADVFAVTPAIIAGELPGQFAAGFSASTKPTLAQVVSFISTADALVALRMGKALGITPTAEDENATLAVRYIVEATKAWVLRIVYTGNAPQDVDAAALPYERAAKLMLDEISSLEAASDASAGTTLGWSNAPSTATRNVASWF